MRSWRPRLLVIVSVLLVMATATQWVGYRLGHAEALRVRMQIAGWYVYPPWGLMRWGRFNPAVLAEGRLMLVAGVVVIGVTTIRVGLTRHRVRPVGKDKWAKLSDMRDAGLVPTKPSRTRVVVGRFKRKLLAYDGPEHQLVTGATRSGKGVGHVVPTLLGGWLESVLVLDIKSELWETTAGFRSRFSHTFFFNPTRHDSVRFNPLLEVPMGENEVASVQNIVNMLIDPEGATAKQTLNIWDQSASAMLTAVIIYCLRSEEEKSLGRVRDLVLDLDRTLSRMIQTPNWIDPETGELKPHPEVHRVAKEMMVRAERSERFAEGIKGTALGYLILYADETVRRNTATSDFRLSDLMCADCPVSLYLQPPPSDAPRLRPLMRLMLNQACRVLMKDLETDGFGNPKKHKLLLELDEFPTLGKLDFLHDALRKLTGYGVKAHIIAQSISDITEAYGQNTSLLDNIHVQVAFGSSDTHTQQRISQMTGTVTEYRRGYSRPRGIFGAIFRRRHEGSVSDGEQVRPLLQPGEVRELPNDEQLVFVTGHPPIRCRKIRYFKDRVFKGRYLLPPDQSLGPDVPKREGGVAHPWTQTWSASNVEEQGEVIEQAESANPEPQGRSVVQSVPKDKDDSLPLFEHDDYGL